MRELWLIRHGETEWSRLGAHTGLSDIPLTAAGRDEATAVGRYLEPRQFALVLVAPLGRARETWEGVDELTATPGCAASTNASPGGQVYATCTAPSDDTASTLLRNRVTGPK